MDTSHIIYREMKGKHLSKEEHREMIYSYCINGKSARECHDALFLGSDQICKLKNVQKIFNLCNDATKETAKIEYLSNCHRRGPRTENRTSPPGAQKGDPGAQKCDPRAHICAPPSSS